MQDNIQKKSYLDIYVILLLLIVIFGLQSFGIFGRTTHFRDYTIIFEGGYRIATHQIPYRDFYIPLGPVTFLVQGFFQAIIGSNLFAMLFHSFILAAILCIIFYFLIRKEFNPFLSYIFAIFFFISFNGLMFQPWYDGMAYFFFFLNFFLLFKYHKRAFIPIFVYLLSALFVTLAFYSKQDVGILQFFFIMFYFIFNYSKEKKSIIFYYIIPSLIMVIGIYFIFSNLFTDFQYRFNLGQSPHESRLINLLNPQSILFIITSWKIYFILLFTYLILLKKQNIISTRLMSLFLVVATTTLITYVTSGGHRQTAAFGIPILIFLIYLLIKDHIKTLIQNNLIKIYILTIILLLIINPLPTYGLISLNYMNKDLGMIDEGCYKRAILQKDALEGLKEIREIIEQNDRNFFSMTEYTFLYCDYNIKPPKNLPLWFHHGTTFFDEDIHNIIKVVESSSPKIILLQDTHNHKNLNLNKEFEEEFISFGYTKIKTINAARSDRPIIILKKD